MNHIPEYKILSKSGSPHYAPEELSEVVNEYLAKGWTVCGSPSVSAIGQHGSVAVIQAMMRTYENKVLYDLTK